MSNIADPNPEARTEVAGHELSVDDLFDVLTESRRRTVLKTLSERGSPTNVEDLARAVAAREQGEPTATVPTATVKEVHVTLHHVHLPKLDDVGLVEYDQSERTVGATEVASGMPIDVE